MAVGPIHHWGDGEAAGEWGGCGGDRGHWRFWVGWGWEVGEFIRYRWVAFRSRFCGGHPV